jgi:ADP-ribose pyrophosphatase YjhB (NUDIX family)
VRQTRYQAFIVQDDRVLLIKHKEHASGREYWLLPGGGLEPGETQEACVAREANEETHLKVRVERLLFDEPAESDGGYQRRKTYLCTPVSGRAEPGYEPESEAAEVYMISQVGWFDLRTESGWSSDLIEDIHTYPQLHRAREALGYRD